MMIERTSCAGCAHDLGGGQCGQSLEGECREGGGHEAWTPRTEFASIPGAARYHDDYMQGMSFRARQTNGGYVVEWGD